MTNTTITFSPLNGETPDEFLLRVGNYKCEGIADMTWEDIATLMREEFGEVRNESTWRKRYKRVSSQIDYCDTCEECLIEDSNIDINTSEILDQELEYQKIKMKLSDQRNQVNQTLRSISRNELIKEIAIECAEAVSKDRFISPTKIEVNNSDKEGLLLISDWHYGIEIHNHYNRYSPEVCKKRVALLRNKVISIIKENGLQHICVLNLGDMIAGLIHNSIRYQSRVDVITQILEVSTILAEFLSDLTDYVKIDYYDTLDNHSRIDINKDETVKLAQLSRIIGPFIKASLQNNPNIVVHTIDENDIESIISFDILNRQYKIAGVHGDKDKPEKAIDNIRGYALEHFDLLVSAHRHHFSADEKNFTLLVCNGSLMGTDDFAENLRLSAYPSQTMIISTKDNVMEKLYRIVLQ